jgi:transposase InsO family protein
VLRSQDQAGFGPAVRDAQLKVEIARVRKENFEVYGADKAWLELGGQGIEVARWTVERLMRGLGLHGARRGRKVWTTVPGTDRQCAGDLAGRLSVQGAFPGAPGGSHPERSSSATVRRFEVAGDDR